MNSFGQFLKIEIYGESHGPAVGCILDGVPAGILLTEQDFMTDIKRRSPAEYADASATRRREKDIPEILSGVSDGHTTGAPVCVRFKNFDTAPESDKEYSKYTEVPRPGHADYTACAKYNFFNDLRGGGAFSGRLSLPIVAAGVIAKKILFPARPMAVLTSIGTENLAIYPDQKAVMDAIRRVIDKAAEAGDSVGGIVRCTCDNLKVGLGEPFFDSVESCISHLIFSIPGVRGIEFGAGFSSSRMKGSQCNDRFIDRAGHTSTNNCGGINGGITNGNQLVFNVAFKPTASITKPQRSFNFITEKMEVFSISGRHDVCFALRTPVIVEACCAIALADLSLRSH
jgi:chorismate synthase